MTAADRIRAAHEATNRAKVSADARAVALALIALAQAVREGRECECDGFDLPRPDDARG